MRKHLSPKLKASRRNQHSNSRSQNANHDDPTSSTNLPYVGPSRGEPHSSTSSAQALLPHFAPARPSGSASPTVQENPVPDASCDGRVCIPRGTVTLSDDQIPSSSNRRVGMLPQSPPESHEAQDDGQFRLLPDARGSSPPHATGQIPSCPSYYSATNIFSESTDSHVPEAPPGGFILPKAPERLPSPASSPAPSDQSAISGNSHHSMVYNEQDAQSSSTDSSLFSASSADAAASQTSLQCVPQELPLPGTELQLVTALYAMSQKYLEGCLVLAAVICSLIQTVSCLTVKLLFQLLSSSPLLKPGMLKVSQLIYTRVPRRVLEGVLRLMLQLQRELPLMLPFPLQQNLLPQPLTCQILALYPMLQDCCLMPGALALHMILDRYPHVQAITVPLIYLVSQLTLMYQKRHLVASCYRKLQNGCPALQAVLRPMIETVTQPLVLIPTRMCRIFCPPLKAAAKVSHSAAAIMTHKTRQCLVPAAQPHLMCRVRPGETTLHLLHHMSLTFLTPSFI
ncbi:hypothetical protein EB796_010403 [Bugula neritina]|uniref:Uncharacterized protein n=1 Tax=Bugula neritina TaxID=10212 RepID=A0A7J7JY03_BUGNE|nr:hypothetical protein EB796_010403 [Bugula neritina]